MPHFSVIFPFQLDHQDLGPLKDSQGWHQYLARVIQARVFGLLGEIRKGTSMNR